MNNEIISNVAEKIKTPAYIFDIADFQNRIRLVKKYFGEEISLCFSIKANPFLTGEVSSEISKLEVCSPGELTICEKTNADMSDIIYSGVNKGAKDIRRAISDGVGIITAESLLHLNLINSAAKEANKKVNVLLRLSSGNQFGIDKETFISVVNNRKSFENIEITGLHYFSGTQKKKTEKIRKELDKIDVFLQELKCTTGFEIKNVEYGTGLATDYFSPDAEELEEKRLCEVSEFLKSFAEKYILTVEMGRFFSAPCGYYFTQVVDIKRNYALNYAICDGGLHQIKYFGQIQGMHTPQITHLSKAQSTGGKERWNLCGSLCTTADVMANEFCTFPVSIEDVFVFHRVGAYSLYEGMSLFLSRDLPRVYIMDAKGSLRPVRDKVNADIFNIQKKE